MIPNFARVADGIFRGGAPSIKDVAMLKRKYGIKKIVSLDAAAGNRIDRACKLLGIKHVMLPIIVGKKTSLLNFLSQDIPKLLDKGGPTFIHCRWGKDRTSLAIALYRIEEDNWTCGKALKEAKKFGFGIGVDPNIIHLYKKLIKKSCGCSEKDMKDVNNADIVSNERDEPDIYGDYEAMLSFAPYADFRERPFPYAKIDEGFPEQYKSRQDYASNNREPERDDYNNEMVQPGQFDQNTQGINGAGPSLVGGGFI